MTLYQMMPSPEGMTMLLGYIGFVFGVGAGFIVARWSR